MRRIALLFLASLAILITACGPAVGTTPTTVATTQPTLPPTEPGPTLPPTTPLPAGVLIDYTREGGFDGTSLHLIINSDGTAKLEGTNYVAPAEWTIDADKLELLKAQIGQPEFATLPSDPSRDSGCADCFIYTINAHTPQGVKTIRFDDAYLSSGEAASPLYQGLNGTLAAVIASAPTPTIPKDPEAVLPNDTLLIFHQEGGIAFSEATLTIKNDGSATLEDSGLPEPVQWMLDADELANIQKSLAAPELVDVKSDGMVMCADCYVYSLAFRSAEGVRYFKVDDADLMDNGLPVVYDVIVLLNTVRRNAPKSI